MILRKILLYDNIITVTSINIYNIYKIHLCSIKFNLNNTETNLIKIVATIQ